MQRNLENRILNKLLLWNYAGIAVMAASALLMNTVIALFYDTAALGIFGETYAWYIILSQISVWGIHMAVMKYVPETDDEEARGAVLKAGLAIAVITSLLITVISEIAICFLDSVGWKKSMQIAFAGLAFFSVNKVLLNYLNAIYRMAAYAAFVSLRYVFIGMGIFIFSFMGIEADYLALVFPMTEVAIFLGMLGYFAYQIPIHGEPDGKTFWKILYFGTKILPSYMALEMNTKVDVVCLGFLVSDVPQIGIYSFAIFFTEGFYMLYITIRKMVNPKIAEANAKGKLSEQMTIIKRSFRMHMALGCAAYIGVSVGYVILCNVMHRPEYGRGITYILIICLAIAINGKYIVLGDVLAQTGYPLAESILNILTVAVNFLLNIILISAWGVVGAAVATAVSHFVFSFWMKAQVKERIGFIL